jgi:hypothetical protein
MVPLWRLPGEPPLWSPPGERGAPFPGSANTPFPHRQYAFPALPIRLPAANTPFPHRQYGFPRTANTPSRSQYGFPGAANTARTAPAPATSTV